MLAFIDFFLKNQFLNECVTKGWVNAKIGGT